VKIVIQSSALADLADGFDFYERNETGVGGYFLDSLYSDIDSLQHYAGIHLMQFGTYHRLLSKKFPYGIYYRVEGNSVLVRAVLDLRRDPKWIRRRLQ
jgi:plasmid stabilization system protein ParE